MRSLVHDRHGDSARRGVSLLHKMLGTENGHPLGHGDKSLIQEPVFAELAAKYGKTSAQIILRWHIQSGNVVIPGSRNPAHIRDNFDVFDFSLTDEEMAKIAAVDKNQRY